MSDVLTFLLASLIIATTPGPSWLYVISRSVGQGPLAGVVAVAGNTTGIAAHMAAVILGLSLVIQQSAAAFMALKAAGALYLAYLGVRIMMRGFQVATEHARPKRLAVVFAEAVLVNATNPKVSLLFLAFLPQFVDATEAGASLKMAGFGAIHMGVATVVTLCLVAISKRIGPAFAASSTLRNIFRWGLGSAFLAIAGRLAVASRF